MIALDMEIMELLVVIAHLKFRLQQFLDVILDNLTEQLLHS